MPQRDARVVITGANGQLGDALIRRMGSRAIAVGRKEWDLQESEGAESLLALHRPTAVIHCAAYTKVDQAESEAELCRAVNAAAVASLAEACGRYDCVLVQISTDYVFGGECIGRPWQETDVPAPQGVYAASKLAGEEAAKTCPAHFIVRTCGLYGGGPDRVSFVEKMLQLAQTRKQLKVVIDQHCTPSRVDDMAAAIEFLLTTEQYGLYHVVNGGATTWFDFAREIFRQSNIEMELLPISTAEFAAPAPRPKYSVLDTAKYRALGGPSLPSWQEALARYLNERQTLGAGQSK